MEVAKVLDDIISLGITPNGFYVLNCLNAKVQVPKLLNVELEKRILVAAGYLDRDGTLTQSAIDSGLISLTIQQEEKQESFNDFVREYIGIWEMAPAKLPSGKYAKCNKMDIAKKLKAFILKYKYNREQVLEATKAYLSRQARDNFTYCRTAEFFISKEGQSDLATEIENFGKESLVKEFSKEA